MRLPQPKRARPDYPKGVRRITDNGGRSGDRYTVEYEPFEGYRDELYQDFVTTSGEPYWPQGICLHGERRWPGAPRFWYDRIIAFADLPADCQRVVREDLISELELVTVDEFESEEASDA